MGSSHQTVIVTFNQPGASFGQDAVAALEDRLVGAIEAAQAGEFDGNLIDCGEVRLFAFGPDASDLFAAMEPHLRAFPARPAHATLRIGNTEQRVEL
ncbi:hypothetical protein [Paractinoplanes rishiriensis]|uniref:Uncharacterized protein n=1 Tax=Paractinoplanes rishiriensis TaxID=1050105 RepID=A0A919K493_9ACTN|nr:hypothetical protein [Actinoplanes rishiriensis]GIF00622.1 hypothetical protein Ari01nite_80860 [Actinoplanes rishiriensis]